MSSEGDSPDGAFTYQALCAIERSIRELNARTGRITESSGFGETVTFTERTAPGAERESVREDLIGAAFVLAQTYIGKKGPPSTPKSWEIWHVANYWKHRDEWYRKGTRHGDTIEAAVRLGGERPSVGARPTLGELTKIAHNALGAPFDVQLLWAAIA